MKAIVDWNRIRSLYEAGNSGRAIAKTMKEAGQTISHVAINAKAKKEGWTKPRDGNVVTAAERYLTMPESDKHKPVMFDKDTPQVRAEILQDIETGLSYELSCQRAAISTDTFKAWRDKDPEFSAEVHRAQANRAMRRIGRIEDAGARGDWKADAYLVERSPETKAMFGGQGNTGGPVINVQINVPTPVPITIDGETVDG